MIENPQDRPAGELPDGRHEAHPPGQESCCYCGVQEGCCSIGFHRLHGPPADKSGGRCGGQIITSHFTFSSNVPSTVILFSVTHVLDLLCPRIF